MSLHSKTSVVTGKKKLKKGRRKDYSSKSDPFRSHFFELRPLSFNGKNSSNVLLVLYLTYARGE